MTGRKLIAVTAPAVRIVFGALLLACLMLPLAPQQAWACGVSYGHLPSFRFDQPRMGLGNECSNTSSLAGAVIVAVLAILVLAAAGARAFERAEATAGSLADQGGSAQALSDYLSATGVAEPASPVSDEGQAGDRGERTGP
jgi:hypothetical protein